MPSNILASSTFEVGLPFFVRISPWIRCARTLSRALEAGKPDDPSKRNPWNLNTPRATDGLYIYHRLLLLVAGCYKS